MNEHGVFVLADRALDHVVEQIGITGRDPR
jgi:hypothetical protein